MGANPLLGVLFHWLGGLSAASFYVPYKRIRGWSWEIFWLTGGVLGTEASFLMYPAIALLWIYVHHRYRRSTATLTDPPLSS